MFDYATGEQPPRIRSIPKHKSTARAEEALDKLIEWGWNPDGAQEDAFLDLCGESEPGKFSIFEFGLVMPRQNGKGDILMARQIVGIFLWGETHVHSAHQFKTAREHFNRVVNFIANSPELSSMCPVGDTDFITTAAGNEAIRTTKGTWLRFFARSRGSIRGFSADVVTLDEAYDLTQEEIDATMPVLSAKSESGSPQMIQASSAGMADSVILAAVRKRGMSGDTARFGYLEWSAAEGDDIEDPEVWRACNPALGLRISEEYVRSELAKARASDGEGLVGWCRERLGIWERIGGEALVDLDQWHSLMDPESTFGRQVAIGFDVSPDGSTAAVALASWTESENVVHIEVLAHEDGSAWLTDMIPAFRKAHAKRAEVFFEASSQAAGVATQLSQLRINVSPISNRDYSVACGQVLSRVDARTLRHRGDDSLNSAIDGARRADVGDSLWKWARKRSLDDITPLVAVTNALHGIQKLRQRRTTITR